MRVAGGMAKGYERGVTRLPPRGRRYRRRRRLREPVQVAVSGATNKYAPPELQPLDYNSPSASRSTSCCLACWRTLL
jgi:hypothetical protein